MWIDGEVGEAVDLFWQLVGEKEPFPRSLERSLAMALPVVLIKMPRLTLDSIEHFLRFRHIPFSFQCQNRPVRGCLIAYGGKGIIFVDGSDPIEEVRFSIAHEVGHFLIDYWLVRRKAVSMFGPLIAEVIDGKRRPNVAERFHAVLGGIHIGVHTNLLDRQLYQPGANPQIWSIEDRADRAALELLAPHNEVLSITDLTLSSYQNRLHFMQSTLIDRYGLPRSVAQEYASRLLTAAGKGYSWAESLHWK